MDPITRTQHFLDLVESGDGRAMAGMLDAEVVWSTPMSASGNPDDGGRIEGREAFFEHMRSLGDLMDSARFVERRVTSSADGSTTFVQARGDFRTRAGKPYCNVYVFRFDWSDDDRITSWEEYANPMTILTVFPELST